MKYDLCWLKCAWARWVIKYNQSQTVSSSLSLSLALDLSVCLTGENGAEFPPAGDSSFRGELAERHLQKEDGQTSAKQKYEVGDEKCTWKHQHKIRQVLHRLSKDSHITGSEITRNTKSAKHMFVLQSVSESTTKITIDIIVLLQYTFLYY